MKGKDWARANLFKGGGAAVEAPPSGIAGWLGGLRLGPAQKAGRLELWPLVHPDAAAEADLIATEAIAAGLLDVQEKDGGTVQELRATNRARRPVILFEGEVLLGAKQNRMVAHTVVIAPGATIVVPVGCVERGRWHWTSRHFSSSDCVAEADLRRSAKASVAYARQSSGRVALDQQALWSEVDAVLGRERVSSPTSDYGEARRQRAAEEAAFARIEPADRQVGLLALREGALVALDLVGSPGTWRGVSDRIVRSLVPASRPGGTPPQARRTAAEWLAALGSARIERQRAVGLGEDVTLTGDALIGSGVWLGSRPAHLSAFASA